MAYYLRLACPTDAAALASIEITARTNDESWTWRFPYRDKYPEDHNYFCTERWRPVLEGSSSPLLTLVACADGSTEPVGFASWLAPTLNESAMAEVAGLIKNHTAKDGGEGYKNPHPHPGAGVTMETRRDRDLARGKHFLERMGVADKLFHSAATGRERNVQLAILAVHPDHQRRGIASQLIAWGADLALRHGLVVTIKGAETPSAMYRHIGCDVVGWWVMQVPGDEGKCVIEEEVLQGAALKKFVEKYKGKIEVQ